MPEPTKVENARPKLLDQVRAAIRLRHYSRRTEKAYVDWIYLHVMNRWALGVRSPFDRL